jgi:hypothetical protein
VTRTGGDEDVLAQRIGFAPMARAKADVWFAPLSEATRAQ